MTTTDKMLTRTEAAARLGVSMRTLDRYIRQGRVTAHKYTTAPNAYNGPGTVRVSEASLTAYLAAAQMTPEGSRGDDVSPLSGAREDS